MSRLLRCRGSWHEHGLIRPSRVSGVPDGPRLTECHSPDDGLAYLVDRNGEANPHIAPGRAGNRGSNANEFSPQAYERAARAARIERRIGLDEILIATEVESRAMQGAHDSMTDGCSHAERI